MRRARPNPMVLAALLIWATFLVVNLIAAFASDPSEPCGARASLPASDAVAAPAVVGGATGLDASATEYTAAAALFRICAKKALAGDFGPLKPWQRNAYQRGLKSATTRRALLTVYGPWEGYLRGQGCAYGYGCSEEIAASNHLTARTVIWIPMPAHLRVIGDTGADWNDPKARRLGCDFWVDLWIPRLGWHGLQNTIYKRDIIVIGR